MNAGAQAQRPLQVLLGFVIITAGGAVCFPGWGALSKTLLAYGLAARIPVAILMIFAFRSNWGTHYDVAPSSVLFLNYVTKYLWIGFVPQLVLWVGFTVVTGMLAGTLAAAVMRLARRVPQPSNAARPATTPPNSS